METFEIIAEPRQSKGKSANRRLCHEGKLPGIVYGGTQDVAAISVSHDDMIHHLAHEAFHSHILTLKTGKKTEKVVLKDVQYHPYKPVILHFDLQRINESAELTIHVPLHFINESVCVGVKRDGGQISHVITDIEITCLPKDLPEYIEVDMANISIGEGVYLSDLNMPEGTRIAALLHGGDASQIVASVHKTRITAEEIEESTETTEDDTAEASTKPKTDE